MSRFIELHRMAHLSDEKYDIIQNVDDIAGVIPQGNHAIVTLRRDAGYLGDVNYQVWESYEEVKRMLIGEEAQKVPWEAD